jgi:hypothetical protein
MSHWYSVCPQCKTAAINGLSGMVPPTQPAESVEIYHDFIQQLYLSQMKLIN